MHIKVWEHHLHNTPYFLVPKLVPHCSNTSHLLPLLSDVPSGAAFLWSTNFSFILHIFQECSPYLLALIEIYSFLQQPSMVVNLYSRLFPIYLHLCSICSLFSFLSISTSRPLLLLRPLIKTPAPLRLTPCGYTTLPTSHRSNLSYQAHPELLQSP